MDILTTGAGARSEGAPAAFAYLSRQALLVRFGPDARGMFWFAAGRHGALCEEQFAYDSEWSLCRVTTRHRASALGMALHRPSGTRYWDCEAAYTFVDHATPGSAHDRSAMAWLKVRLLTKRSVPIEDGNGVRGTLHVVGEDGAGPMALDKAKDDLALWQRITLERLSDRSARAAAAAVRASPAPLVLFGAVA